MRLSALAAWLVFSTMALAEPYKVSVTTGGITMHGATVDPELADGMPKKIDAEGRFVYHPVELGVTVNHQIWQFNGYYLKDSFYEPAVYLGAGFAVPFPFKNLMLGGTAGIYTRKVEYFKTSKGQRIEIDCGDYCLDFGGVQTFPTAFLTGMYTWPIQESTNFMVAIASNYVLTHMTFGIQYRFGR